MCMCVPLTNSHSEGWLAWAAATRNSQLRSQLPKRYVDVPFLSIREVTHDTYVGILCASARRFADLSPPLREKDTNEAL